MHNLQIGIRKLAHGVIFIRTLGKLVFIAAFTYGMSFLNLHVQLQHIKDFNFHYFLF